MKTYEAFKQEVLGRAYDVDGYYGAQCWDGAMYYSTWLGYPVFHCPITCYAQDIWTQRNVSGILDYYTEVEMMNPGDIAVFTQDQNWTPASHIAIFDSDIDGTFGYFLGQNQGGEGMSFNLAKLPYSATYPTAFRPKCFATETATKPETTGTHGLDLSVHNGDLDFKALKAQGNEFVILRAGYGWSMDNKDPRFEEYYKQAKEVGMKIGAYWYSYGRNLEEAKGEADCFKKAIQGKEFDFGIWVDLEDADHWKQNNGNPSGEMQAKVANLIADEMKKAGYQTGIYASTYWIDNIFKGLDIKNHLLWEANYGANDGQIHSNHSNRAILHQYTSQWSYGGKVFDRNICYGSLTQPEHKPELQKEPERSVYRFYNATSGDHLYTISYEEGLSVLKAGWGYEGVCWIAPKEGKDVHRLYNPNTGIHHYCFEEEKDNLVKLGWNYDGVAFKSGGNKPVYRLYNPNNGMHVLSANQKEHDALSQIGWVCEGQDIKY